MISSNVFLSFSSLYNFDTAQEHSFTIEHSRSRRSRSSTEEEEDGARKKERERERELFLSPRSESPQG